MPAGTCDPATRGDAFPAAANAAIGLLVESGTGQAVRLWMRWSE